MANQKFYICKKCGNLIGFVDNQGVPVVCCGQKMDELVPNTVDAATEKHIPDVSVDKDSVIVKVGTDPHPMLEEHHISFVYLQTKQGGQRKKLDIGSKPEVQFKLVDDILISVYAYCNLHGLWKKDF